MIYFTAGPSQEYPRLREFITDALAQDIHSISHRSARFAELFRSTSDALVELLGVPPDRQAFFAGSATEWMERCVQNMSTQRTLHFVSGTFSKRFYDFSLSIGRDARKVDQRPDGSFSLDDAPKDFAPELVALTHNETSNGTQLSPEFFAEMKKAYPDAQIALDVVSSAPVYPDVFADADVLFFSVQKNFGMPAGLGVALVSPQAIDRSALILEAGQYTGFFHSFTRLAEYAKKGNTVETPNVFSIFLLNAIARDMLERGRPALLRDMREKAAILHDAFAHSKEIFLDEAHAEEYRSRTVIVGRTPGGSAPVIARIKQSGFLIASGYGADKETHIRIANFVSHPRADIETLAALL